MNFCQLVKPQEIRQVDNWLISVIKEKKRRIYRCLFTGNKAKSIHRQKMQNKEHNSGFFCATLLILPYWNVNQTKLSNLRLTCLAFNLTILECKSVKYKLYKFIERNISRMNCILDKEFKNSTSDIATKYIALCERETGEILAYGTTNQVERFYKSCSPLVKQWCKVLWLDGLTKRDADIIVDFIKNKHDMKLIFKVLSLKKIDYKEKTIAHILAVSRR